VHCIDNRWCDWLCHVTNSKTDNIFIRIISAPGMWIQRMTTKEPDKGMIEVAIAAVEAVFDWKKYLYDNFGYEVDEKWMQEENAEGQAEE